MLSRVFQAARVRSSPSFLPFSLTGVPRVAIEFLGAPTWEGEIAWVSNPGEAHVVPYGLGAKGTPLVRFLFQALASVDRNRFHGPLLHTVSAIPRMSSGVSQTSQTPAMQIERATASRLNRSGGFSDITTMNGSFRYPTGTVRPPHESCLYSQWGKFPMRIRGRSSGEAFFGGFGQIQPVQGSEAWYLRGHHDQQGGYTHKQV